MVLHIFNPEHDLALAAGISNFTAPHAGRRLRVDLGFLPALWSGEDDCVLVDNVAQATRTYGRIRARVGSRPGRFVEKAQLPKLQIDQVKPWGWDLALRSFLLRCGVEAVPSEKTIADIRNLSHRKHAADLLSQLQIQGTTGLSWQADGLEEIRQLQSRFGRIVVKAPWSSSGRGVRFLDSGLSDYQERWISHVIERQGSVVVEPYYNKVKDFGMEFESDGRGTIRYLGLSLFQTRNGAYTGNIIASEEDKRSMIRRYVSDDLLNDIQENICNHLGLLYKDRYQGPFGIDMMIVARPDGDGFLLHPCVEINLRRTMGHVALSIPPFADGFTRVMQITLTDKYRLQIRKQ